MASKGKQTDLCRFPSKYAPNTYVTAQQYILELICERQANFNKKSLSVYFWRDKEWANIYKRWLRQVHKLSKQYSAKAILAALQDDKAKYKWSLNTPFMKDLIEIHHKRILEQEKNRGDMTPIEIAGDESFRKSKPTALINKLEELD